MYLLCKIQFDVVRTLFGLIWNEMPEGMDMNSQNSLSRNLVATFRSSTMLAVAAAVLLAALMAPKEADAAPTRSTTIALTPDETRVVVVNREANSVSIIQVKDGSGNDIANKLVEIGVGEEPRCVAVHPSNRAAYVTNAISGTVSVIDLMLGREVAQIPVGTEPRGCALTADGSFLYVTNHTEGAVSIMDPGNPLRPDPRWTRECWRQALGRRDIG